MDVGEAPRAEGDPLADSERIYLLPKEPDFGLAVIDCDDPECRDERDHEALVIRMTFEHGQRMMVAIPRAAALSFASNLMRAMHYADFLREEAA